MTREEIIDIDFVKLPDKNISVTINYKDYKGSTTSGIENFKNLTVLSDSKEEE